MISKRFPKILLYYIFLVITIVVVLFAIEGLNIYHFDAQLGMAIVIWGIIGFVVLLAVLLIGMLVEFILKKRKNSS